MDTPRKENDNHKKTRNDHFLEFYSSPTTKFLLTPLIVFICLYAMLAWGGISIKWIKYGDLSVDVNTAGNVNSSGVIEEPVTMIINFWTPSEKTIDSYQNTDEYKAYKKECETYSNPDIAKSEQAKTACDKIEYTYNTTS